MATLEFGSLSLEADLVVFDKDGTLIDFLPVWGHRTRRSIEALATALAPADELPARLSHALGYCLTSHRFLRPGPVLTASMAELNTVAATVLFQHGLDWLEAKMLVEAHFTPIMNEAVRAGDLRPTADLPSLFGRLTGAGVRVAVVTSDDLVPTQAALDHLQLNGEVALVIGADSGYPAKPAPDALLAVCSHLRVPPDRAVMVGDSTTDMVMARRAGLAGRVAVLTGGMTRDQLTPAAHVVLESVRDIRVAPA